MQENRETALVVGLGNPGKTYTYTRHNLGFLVLDELAKRQNLFFKKSARLEAEVASSGALHLVKPMTYMNLSGRSVVKAVQYYKVPLARLLVVVDDVYLKVGTMRLRPEGGDGGHNGLKSVTLDVGGAGYPRLRMGVGPQHEEERPQAGLEEYVLAPFTSEEQVWLPDIVRQGSEVIMCWLLEGALAASQLAGNISKTFKGFENP